MFNESNWFKSVNNSLIAWVGDLNDSQLDDYLDEPGDCLDSEPQSKFGSDLGRWYDHDFIYAEASDKPLHIRLLAEKNCIDDEALISELESRARELNITSAHCFIILWNAQIIGDERRVFASGKLSCLGSWEHESPLTDD